MKVENKKELIKKLKPFWNRYEKLQSKFLTKTEELENEMNKNLKLKIKLEFFHVDGEVVGIGAENYSKRKKFPLIDEGELNE